MLINKFYISCFCAILYSCGNIQEAKKIIAKNSSLKLNNGVLFYNDKPFSGNLIDYHKNNNLKSDITYKNGRKNGLEQQWYKNGLLAQKRFYKNGVKFGIHTGWWHDGTLQFEYHFNHEGAYHGTVKEWYKNGEIYKLFNYTNGKESGRQKLWKTNGSIKANYDVVNNERFGLIGLKKCYTVTTESDFVK